MTSEEIIEALKNGKSLIGGETGGDILRPLLRDGQLFISFTAYLFEGNFAESQVYALKDFDLSAYDWELDES